MSIPRNKDVHNMVVKTNKDSNFNLKNNIYKIYVENRGVENIINDIEAIAIELKSTICCDTSVSDNLPDTEYISHYVALIKFLIESIQVKYDISKETIDNLLDIELINIAKEVS